MFPEAIRRENPTPPKKTIPVVTTPPPASYGSIPTQSAGWFLLGTLNPLTLTTGRKPLPPHSVETQVVQRWFYSSELPEARGLTTSESLFELPVTETFKSVGLASGKGIYTVEGHMSIRLRQTELARDNCPFW